MHTKEGGSFDSGKTNDEMESNNNCNNMVEEEKMDCCDEISDSEMDPFMIGREDAQQLQDEAEDGDEDRGGIVGNLNEIPDREDNDGCPFPEMIFDEAAQFAEYCHQYAYQKGFEFRIRSNGILPEFKEAGVRRRTTGPKQAKYHMMNMIRYECKKAVEGCPVVVTARLNKEKLFVVTSCKMEHNHELDPVNSKRMLNFRYIDDYVFDKCMEQDLAGVPIVKIFNTILIENGGDYNNMTFNRRDLRNALNAWRRRQIIGGDALALEDYFAKMKEDNPLFYSAIQKDDEGRLKNVFWSDARCRTASKYFGHVITFDTTFLCNRYRMPFAPFVGVNHHGSSILLAAGLITHECTESFVWLFNQWVFCMGEAPKSILTDQDRAIASAIKIVFGKNCNHRLCLWHMMQNAGRALGRHKQYRKIRAAIKRSVHDSLSIGEFEEAWQEMVNAFDLHDYRWVKDAFEIRDRWVPAYWRGTFSAGMSSTQRSEGINAFIKGYVSLGFGLIRFVKQYEAALHSKIEQERNLDLASKNKPLSFDDGFFVEAAFHPLYTNAKFQEIKNETAKLKYTNLTKFTTAGSMVIYHANEKMVKRLWKKDRNDYTVTLKKDVEEFHCTCKLFEFRGILCNHIISALDLEGIEHISEKYIVDQWRKDLVRDYENIAVGLNDPDEAVVVLRKQMVRHACSYIEKLAIMNENTMKVFMDGSDELRKKLQEAGGIEAPGSVLSSTHVEGVRSDVFGRARIRPTEDTRNVATEGNQSSPGVDEPIVPPEAAPPEGTGCPIKDPVVLYQQGRPPKGRTKNPAELKKKSSVHKRHGLSEKNKSNLTSKRGNRGKRKVDAASPTPNKQGVGNGQFSFVYPNGSAGASGIGFQEIVGPSSIVPLPGGQQVQNFLLSSTAAITCNGPANVLPMQHQPFGVYTQMLHHTHSGVMPIPGNVSMHGNGYVIVNGVGYTPGMHIRGALGGEILPTNFNVAEASNSTRPGMLLSNGTR